MKKPVVAFRVMIAAFLFCLMAACSTGGGAQALAEAGGAYDPPQAVQLPQLPPSGSIPRAPAAAEFSRWHGSAWTTYCLAVGPDGTIAASGDYAEVFVFSADGKLDRRFPVEDSAVPWGLAFSADGKALALATPFAPSRIVDADTGAELKDGLPWASSCSFSNAPRSGTGRFAFGGTSGRISTFKAPDWRPDYEWDAYAAGGIGKDLLAGAYSPDGRLIASGGLDSTLLVWHSEDGSMVQRWESGTSMRNDLNGLAWSPDGSRIATARLDGTLRVHNTDSGLDLWGVAFDGWLRAVA